MRPYEMVVVLQADLDEEDLQAQLVAIKGWIESSDGSIVEIDTWGRRRLAYPINKQREGYYTIYKLSLPAAAPLVLERNLRLNENVLRFLITRDDE